MRCPAWTAATAFGVAVMGLPLWLHSPTVLMWNASRSVPIGLYALRAPQPLHLGDLVAAAAPKSWSDFIVRRHYLPRGTPLLKHVAALPGAEVCRRGATIVIDGRLWGFAKSRDRLGRPLPVWSGCRILAPNQVFLMNPRVSDSLDGRYFGPWPSSSLIGRAVPLWTDETDSGRYQWRAPSHGVHRGDA